MQSAKQQTQSSNNYLYRILVYGAKPFLYRGRVRLLLGFPGWAGGNVAFPPVLPPVGFRYANANHTSMAYSRDYKHSPGDTDSLSLQDEQRQELENIGDNKLIEKMTPGNGQAPGKTHDRMITRQMSSMKDENREDNSGLETEMKAFPGEEAREKQSIDIPGFSDRNISYPFLDGERNNNTIGLKTGKPAPRENSPADLNRDFINKSFIFNSEKSQRVEKVKESVPETEAILQDREAKPVVHNIGTGKGKINPRPGKEEVTETENRFRERMEKSVNPVTIPGSREFQKVEKVKESVPETEAILHDREANPVVHDIGTGKGKINPRPGKEEVTETENQFHSKRENSVGQSSISVLGSKKSQNPKGIKNRAVNPQLMSKIEKSQEPGIVKERAAETQLLDNREEPVNGDVKIINSKAKVKANPDYEFGSQAYWNSVARVEQLRQQVLRLNTLNTLKTKILSSSSGVKVNGTRGIKKEEQLQIPDSPVPPVVMVKRPSQQRRTPRTTCAFWERSYLGRFHLRTLR